MPRFRILLVAFLCTSLIATPIYSSSATALGTVVAADRAQVDDAAASIGATIYGGDRLSTGAGGSLQLRTAGSRLLLSESSSAAVADGNGTVELTLVAGTAVFSTSSAKGFALLFKDARLRPFADGPTIAQVKIAGPKELLVTTRRGALLFSRDDDSEVIPEGNTFRVILDPPESAAAQGPRGVGAGKGGGPPRRAARNRSLIIIATTVGVATAIAIHEALESPDRP